MKFVSCPRCGAQALYSPENRWRPFCSERCRVIDLGAWASEAYRVPVAPEAEDNALPDQKPEER
ncbi:MAG TPA: DNA gyrase inhibitor YacG [Burkholderiales bacterium]|nr:DNA gyrase inhibitor YacG [Burkholderiales bacterium]